MHDYVLCVIHMVHTCAVCCIYVHMPMCKCSGLYHKEVICRVMSLPLHFSLKSPSLQSTPPPLHAVCCACSWNSPFTLCPLLDSRLPSTSLGPEFSEHQNPMLAFLGQITRPGVSLCRIRVLLPTGAPGLLKGAVLHGEAVWKGWSVFVSCLPAVLHL